MRCTSRCRLRELSIAIGGLAQSFATRRARGVALDEVDQAWLQQGRSVLTPYADTLAGPYGAPLATIDFDHARRGRVDDQLVVLRQHARQDHEVARGLGSRESGGARAHRRRLSRRAVGARVRPEAHRTGAVPHRGGHGRERADHAPRRGRDRERAEARLRRRHGLEGCRAAVRGQPAGDGRSRSRRPRRVREHVGRRPLRVRARGAPTGQRRAVDAEVRRQPSQSDLVTAARATRRARRVRPGPSRLLRHRRPARPFRERR